MEVSSAGGGKLLFPALCPEVWLRNRSPESPVLGERSADCHGRCDKVCQVWSCPKVLGNYSMSDSAGGQ